MVPWILTTVFPECEQEAARHVADNLSALDQCVEELAAANALFDHCEWNSSDPPDGGSRSLEEMQSRHKHNSLLMRWSFIAARIGAMTIHDFYRISQLTSGLRPQCPSLFEHVDNTTWGEANSLFQRSFKDFGALRQNAAHGERYATPDRTARAYSDEPLIASSGHTVASGLSVRNGLINRTYTTALDGRYVSYNLDQATVDALRRVADLIFEAFRPVERATRVLLIEQRKHMREQPRPG